jgi:hypothetical protein
MKWIVTLQKHVSQTGTAPCTHASLCITADCVQMGAPGELPPNSSDEEGSSSDDSEPAPAPPPRRAKKQDDDADPDQMAKDMERLKLARQQREQQRLKRIEQEGWDRYAPVSATNKPPDARPADHPDFQK